MADRSDLWGPRVRKWMTEWHSPVAGYTLGRPFRGSGGYATRIADDGTLRVVDVSFINRLTDRH